MALAFNMKQIMRHEKCFPCCLVNLFRQLHGKEFGVPKIRMMEIGSVRMLRTMFVLLRTMDPGMLA